MTTEARQTTQMTDEKRVSDDKLREIIAGCEGVTPGPWEMIDLGGNANAMVCDTEDTILSVHRRTRPKAFETAIAAHIARLDPQTVAAICEELLARRSPPSGYRLVPEEPTEAMTKAGFGPFLAAHDPFFNKNEPTAPIYRAMLAAAPSPKEGK